MAGKGKKSAERPPLERAPRAIAPGEPFGPELELWADGIELVIGTDEAGRGPLAGPVVAAAVAFRPEARIAGIGDSKTIRTAKREELYEAILEGAAAWAIVEKSHDWIDRINILQATRRAMDEAVIAVADELGVRWPTLLVDGRIPRLSRGHHINLTGGDGRSFSIGAASILAKVHRDRLMDQLADRHPGYGFEHNRGYPTAEHIDALLKLGPSAVHRRSFTLSGGSEAPRIAIGELRAGLTRRSLAKYALERRISPPHSPEFDAKEADEEGSKGGPGAKP